MTIEEKSAVIPDITKLSLDSFGTLPNSEQGVADIISLSDLSSIVDLRDMTLGLAIQDWNNRQMETLSLEKYPFIANLTLSEIADLTNLYDIEVGDLPLAETALSTFLQHPILAIERRLTLAQVLDKYPGIGEFKLGFLNLAEYNYKAIPNLLNIPITAIPGWDELKPSAILGLRKLILHQNIQVDGEIVSLTTVPEEKRINIRLQDETGLSIEWSEKPSDGLTPFDSYSITPTLAGEKIIVNAYFSSCNKDDCSLIGPFQYTEHKKGDSIYVSASDWALAERESTPTVKFSRESPENENVIAPKAPLYELSSFKIAIAGVLCGFTLGVFLIYRLLRSVSRNS